MARRKDRIVVLLDTNVVVRAITNSSGKSASARVWELWLRRRLQLVVSPAVVDEYAEILERLGVASARVERFIERLNERETVTHVNLGRRLRLTRDPEDEFILSTADTARADYLITLDRDLLEMPWAERRRLRFEIGTPAEFLRLIEA